MTTNKAAEALHPSAERWARMFHDAYELAAPLFGYETREASRKPWGQVPENNRALMTAVAGHVGAAIIAEATAQQAAEVARLVGRLRVVREDGVIGHPELDLSYFPVWHLDGTRCDLCDILAAAPAVAPDPAPPAPGERCAWAQRCGMPESDRRHQDPWDMHPGLYKHDFQPEPAP